MSIEAIRRDRAIGQMITGTEVDALLDVVDAAADDHDGHHEVVATSKYFACRVCAALARLEEVRRDT